MKRRALPPILVLVLLVASSGIASGSVGVRSVGLRVILPFTGIPLWIGAEVVTEAAFGDLSISLFLSPAGGSLLLGSADVALTSDPDGASAFLRFSTGLAYLDASRRLPSWLVGAGTGVRLLAIEPFLLGLSGELIYPVAFPTPMITLSGAWALL